MVGIYVARYLGPEKFGVFSYALAFVALFSSISKLGLDGIIVRDLVNEPEKRDLYLGTAFWLKILGALLAGFGVIIAIIITPNEYTTKLYISIIASGLIFQSFEVVDFYFQSRVLSKYVSICKMSQLLISSILKLYLVSKNEELFWFVLVSVIDQASLGVALAYAYSRQRVGLFYFHFDKNIAKKLLISTKPLIISGIMVSVYSNIDRVFIKEMLDTKEVGLYAVATGLTGALYFIPTLIANSLFPAILNAKKQSEDIYNRRLSLLYKAIFFFGLCACVFISVFAEPIIIFLYGSKFLESAGVLQVYIWNLLIVCFSAIFGNWLLSENLQYLVPRFTFVALVLNVLGCWALIPLWSIKGAALATFGAQLISFILFGIINKRLWGQIKLAFKIL